MSNIEKGPEAHETAVADGIVRLFEAASTDAAVKANIERTITAAFESAGEPKPGATPEELSQRWDAIFEGMWRGLGCNVLPFPERSGSGTSTGTEGGEA